MQTEAVPRVRRQHRPDVGIQHDQPTAVLALDEFGQRRRHRLQHQTKRSEVQGVDLRRQFTGNPLARKVRRCGSLDDELVFREAILANIGDGDGGRLRAEARERKAGSISREPVGQQAPELVLRKVPEKCRGNSQPSERPRGIKGAAAGCRPSRAVVAEDHVNQRFTANNNHATILPDPRAFRAGSPS